MKKFKQLASILLIGFVLMFSLGAGISKVNAANNLTFGQIQSIKLAIQSILQQIQALTLQLNQLSQQSNQNTQYDQFSGWKTYKNDSAGFEMKYPPEFNLVEDDKKGIINKAVELRKDNSSMQIIFNPIITGGGCGNADEYTFFTLVYLEDMQRYERAITINNQPLKIMYNILNPGYCNDALAGLEIEKCITDTRISAYIAPKLATSFCEGFSVNGAKYSINFGGKFNVKNADEASQIFEKILSTIKFTAPKSIIEANQNPYIEVLQPVRQLREGDDYSYSIQWNQAGLGDKNANIYLDAFNQNGQAIDPKPEYAFIDGSSFRTYLIAKSVPVSHQSFNWMIPVGLSERFRSIPDKYKIRIASAPTLSGWGVKPEKLQYNQSKDYFTVLK